MQAGEVVAEDLGVGVVAVAVTAAAGKFATSSYAVGLGGRTGGVTGGWPGGTALELFVVLAVDFLFEVRDPAVDFGLGFEEAFADVLFDYWEVVCGQSADGPYLGRSNSVPSRKLWSRSSYSPFGFSPVSLFGFCRFGSRRPPEVLVGCSL